MSTQEEIDKDISVGVALKPEGRRRKTEISRCKGSKLDNKIG